MITVEQGQKKRFDIQGQSISGIHFDVFSKNSTTSSSALADISAVDVSIILYQGGKETTIASGNLQPLAMESMFLNGNWESADGSAGIPVAANTSSVKNEYLLPTSIDFGGVINLRGDDKITVECRIGSSFAPTGVDEATSYVTVSAKEGIGLQWTTPKIQYQTIGSGESNFRQNIGDNCTRVAFINTNVTTNVTASQPLSSARLYSDRYNVNDGLTQLLSKRGQQFPSDSVSNDHNASFLLLNKEVDDCRVELDLTSANVASGKNFVVWRTFETSGKQVDRAKRSKAKHHAKAVRKLRGGARG